MILVGLDDTDMPDTRGTNYLARGIIGWVASRYRCLRIVRHQLFVNDAIPYTSHNGSASMHFEAVDGHEPTWLLARCRERIVAEAAPGSDPGLCLAEQMPDSIVEFAQRCKREVVTQAEARRLAAENGIHLEGLGGTEGGVIGALAAVGLASTNDDGRVIHVDGWDDDLTGVVPLERVVERGVVVRQYASGASVESGLVEIPKRLRPNVVAGQITLWVEPGQIEPHGAVWKSMRVQ